MEAAAATEKKELENKSAPNPPPPPSPTAAGGGGDADGGHASEDRERQDRELKAGLHPLKVLPFFLSVYLVEDTRVWWKKERIFFLDTGYGSIRVKKEEDFCLF